MSIAHYGGKIEKLANHNFIDRRGTGLKAVLVKDIAF
jgi:hypothetical protein